MPELDPGIRDLVWFLRDNEFDTTDSGDGYSKADANGVMPDCSIAAPHVFMIVDADKMVEEAHRLFSIMEELVDMNDGPSIEVSYSPQDGQAVLQLWHVLSEDIPNIKELIAG